MKLTAITVYRTEKRATIAVPPKTSPHMHIFNDHAHRHVSHIGVATILRKVRMEINQNTSSLIPTAQTYSVRSVSWLDATAE